PSPHVADKDNEVRRRQLRCWICCNLTGRVYHDIWLPIIERHLRVRVHEPKRCAGCAQFLIKLWDQSRDHGLHHVVLVSIIWQSSSEVFPDFDLSWRERKEIL